MGDDGVQAAVLLHQVPGALLPDALHALDVVAGVPHEGEHVHHLLGPDPEPLLDPGPVDPHLPIAVVQDLDAAHVVHQLQEILVRAHDDTRHSGSAGLGGQGAHDVVGLVPRQFHDADVQGLGQVPDQGDLRAQVLGHLGAVGLVVRIDLVPEGGLGPVEDHGQVGGLVLGHQRQHHARHGHGGAVLEAQVAVVRPENEREGVDQVKAVLSHSPPRCSGGRSRVSAQRIPRG